MAKKVNGSASGPLSCGSDGLLDSPKVAAEEPSYGDDPAQGNRRLRSTEISQGSSRQASKPDPDPNTNEQVDQRPTRKKWPKDKTKKLAAMAKAMPEYIVEYFGGEVAISAAMYSTQSDVRRAISSDPDLMEMQAVALSSKEALLADRMMYLALNTKSSAPVKFLLENQFPEKWGKKPAGSGKARKGFKPPDQDPKQMKSVLGVIAKSSDGSPSDVN